MPQKAWSDKRERQYEHINKERAEHGETKSQKSQKSR
jgi:hypothetical protein